MVTIRKVNYINNKDFLKEIHKSKNSYCWYKEKRFADYDLIIFDIEDMRTRLEEAREARATRLSKLPINDEATEFTKVDPKTIPDYEIVFRLMCWDHIPDAPPKERKAKKTKTTSVIEDNDLIEEDDDGIAVTEEVTKKERSIKELHVKVNFPPFAHWRFNEDGKHEQVGLSHWKGGDRHTGQFCRDHGSLSTGLAKMFMKMCERYGTKGNWRNYTYNDEMQSHALLQLSRVGLQFDESKSQNPFAYFTTTVKNSFTHVFNDEHEHQKIRDDILEQNDLSPSYTRQNSGGHDGGDD